MWNTKLLNVVTLHTNTTLIWYVFHLLYFTSIHHWKPGLVLHRAIHKAACLPVPAVPRRLLLQLNQNQISLVVRMIHLGQVPTSQSHHPCTKSLLLVQLLSYHQVEHPFYQDSNNQVQLSIHESLNCNCNNLEVELIYNARQYDRTICFDVTSVCNTSVYLLLMPNLSFLLN